MLSAPTKPWEIENMNKNPRDGSSFWTDNRNPTVNRFAYLSPENSTIGGGGTPSIPRSFNRGTSALNPLPAQVPPPLPPLDNNMGYQNSFMPQYGHYNTPGSYMYNNNGNLYNNFNSGYGNAGMNGPLQMMNNEMYMLAEENSRDAFDSINSVVRAFQSVTFMLESTFNAVHSSFYAMVNMASHISSLKNNFSQILSSVALIRTMKWLYKKLLYLIGLSRQDPGLDSTWSTVTTQNPIPGVQEPRPRSSWAVMMFMAFSYMAPFLLWKMANLLMKSHLPGWATGQQPSISCVALYDLKSTNSNNLSFKKGQILYFPPSMQNSTRQWSIASDGNKTGLVPKNYFSAVASRPVEMYQKQGNENAIKPNQSYQNSQQNSNSNSNSNSNYSSTNSVNSNTTENKPNWINSNETLQLNRSQNIVKIGHSTSNNSLDSSMVKPEITGSKKECEKDNGNTQRDNSEVIEDLEPILMPISSEQKS